LRWKNPETVSEDTADVNYLRKIVGHEFNAKDFRTWAGTVLAAQALQSFPAWTSKAQAKRNVTAAIAAVAATLGNTKSVCRKCYVHPHIVEAYMEGNLGNIMAVNFGKRPKRGFRPEEWKTLLFLEQRSKLQSAR